MPNKTITADLTADYVIPNGDTLTIDTTAGDITITKVISSGLTAAGLIIEGGNTVRLANQNTYYGPTCINAGTLKGVCKNALSPNSDIRFCNSTTVATPPAAAMLDLGGFDQTIANLYGGGSYTAVANPPPVARYSNNYFVTTTVYTVGAAAPKTSTYAASVAAPIPKAGEVSVESYNVAIWGTVQLGSNLLTLSGGEDTTFKGQVLYTQTGQAGSLPKVGGIVTAGSEGGVVLKNAAIYDGSIPQGGTVPAINLIYKPGSIGVVDG